MYSVGDYQENLTRFTYRDRNRKNVSKLLDSTDLIPTMIKKFYVVVPLIRNIFYTRNVRDQF